MPEIKLPKDISIAVQRALDEDIGSGDITAALVPEWLTSNAVVISREPAILCGTAWFDEVFRQLDPAVAVAWRLNDGDSLAPDQPVCTVAGPARSLLTGERTALNFLQLLSGTATTTRNYVQTLGGAKTRLLDTRKTLPGLRSAQKYAVACGGGSNHRLGLYDAILIKENHIEAAGGIQHAIRQAKSLNKPIEIEVENLDQLQQAIAAGADRIMLDNFSMEMISTAVRINASRAELEVSGGIAVDALRTLGGTGVDYVSIGALTKHVQAIDFSMRIVPVRA
jgi:nicotinate-nucleotide pyrophosphorylase (carboxylating)